MSLVSPAKLRRARLVDRIVAGLITAGGGAVLLATLLLVVFLLVEAVPLLKHASAVAQGEVRNGAPLAATEDEYRESVAVVLPDGTLQLVGRKGDGARIALEGVTPPVRQAAFASDGRLLAALDASGTVRVWSWRQRVTWEGERRVLQPRLRLVGSMAVEEERALLDVAGDSSTAFVLLAAPDGAELLKIGEDGSGRQALHTGEAGAVGALASDGSRAWVASRTGLAWFRSASGDGEPVDPDATAPLPRAPTAATVLLGDETLLLGDAAGTVTGWQALAGVPAGRWTLDRSAAFRGPGPVRAIASSQRDKSFLVVRPARGDVDYLTTRHTLVELPGFPAGAVIGRLSPRLDGAFAITAAGEVHRWALNVEHPEVTLRTLLLPVRYEGYAEADLVWQSTGGSAGFEPKLSLVPLIVGTVKGALYALLFSAPLALAGALYVNQFAPLHMREWVKPTVELMAAVPSVVVGFLAALFLAPLVRQHLVASLGIFVLLPLVVVAALVWSAAPGRMQRRLVGGRELAVVAVVVAAGIAFLLLVEHRVEAAWFGGDLAHWLYERLGIAYDQRNAVVVGFALGFAVIPIIFTIAEDAFSNVPPSLVAASLALGATRWQAARSVVVPAASPGLFAAVMLGLGRAVGETMIVLMATGNTPLLSFSPFNGMRTMSACIAVELPEAPYGGTLYRVLILTALLLFVFTFVINVVAAAVAARLRKRFGRLAA